MYLEEIDIRSDKAYEAIEEMVEKSSLVKSFDFTEKRGDFHFSHAFANVYFEPYNDKPRAGLFSTPGQCGICQVTELYSAVKILPFLIEVAEYLGFGKMMATDTEDRPELVEHGFKLVNEFYNPRTLNKVRQYEKIINEDLQSSCWNRSKDSE